MKLTKRGKQARALLILAGLILAFIVAGGYRATHYPIYKCHTDKVGETICKLIGYEGNK
jgi:hypothetical protein